MLYENPLQKKTPQPFDRRPWFVFASFLHDQLKYWREVFFLADHTWQRHQSESNSLSVFPLTRPSPLVAQLTVAITAQTSVSKVLKPLIDAVITGQLNSSIDGSPISFKVSNTGFRFLTSNGKYFKSPWLIAHQEKVFILQITSFRSAFRFERNLSIIYRSKLLLTGKEIYPWCNVTTGKVSYKRWPVEWEIAG